jgi:hypothetical protein
LAQNRDEFSDSFFRVDDAAADVEESQPIGRGISNNITSKHQQPQQQQQQSQENERYLSSFTPAVHAAATSRAAPSAATNLGTLTRASSRPVSLPVSSSVKKNENAAVLDEKTQVGVVTEAVQLLDSSCAVLRDVILACNRADQLVHHTLAADLVRRIAVLQANIALAKGTSLSANAKVCIKRWRVVDLL